MEFEFGFRSRLKRELPRWRQEGIVDEAAAARIGARYRLDEDSMPAALLAVYVLGVLLVGGGVLAFVAWHWESLSGAAKMGLGLAALVAAHAGGWHLWHGSGSRPKLGHALMVLGTLLLGANIGIAAQVFHVHSNWFGGFGAWALGALAAAAFLRSAPTALVAVALSFVWAVGSITDTWPRSALAELGTPFLVAAALGVLAARLRSVPVMFLALVAVGVLFPVAAGRVDVDALAPVVLAVSMLYLALPSAFPAGSAGRALLAPAAGLGLLGGIGACYVLSFHEVAKAGFWNDLSREELWHALVLCVPPLAGAALIVARRLLAGAPAGQRPVAAIAGAGALLVSAAMFADETQLPVAITANLALVAVIAASLASSARTLQRGPFWAGNFLGGLLILSRFLEFETELWLKALAFTACGAAVIVAGAAFERRTKRAEVRHAA